MNDTEKLQKVLARAGIASRREAETMIQAGRIKVNGKVATLGDRVSATDKIAVDDNLLKPATMSEKPRLIIYNKPEGEVCSREDPEGRPTVFRRLPELKSGRWIVVGRLDINTTGLLLFTTDGELANRLMHPSTGLDREYVVRIRGEVTDDMTKALKDGVLLEDGMARFTDMKRGRPSGSHEWFNCVVMEGRNREVRRLWESQGLTVSRLKRVRFGHIFLPSRLARGRWEYVGQQDAAVVYEMAGLAVPEVYLPRAMREDTPQRKSGPKAAPRRPARPVRRR